MRLTIAAPPGFAFERTVLSHGWCRLEPFRFDDDARTLSGVACVPGGGAVSYRLSSRDGRIVVESPGRGDRSIRDLLRATAWRVLNLELDLAGFHDVARRSPGMEWIATIDGGRLLRASSAFEDLIKLVLTTNCNWAFTTRMTETLVERYGEAATDGRRAFPTAEALARVGTREIRERCRTGYRAPAIVHLAREAATGRLDPETWESDPRDPSDLRREMLELPGVGPYVAENMLRFMGRPAGLGLDSWLRSKYARVYHGGRPVKDRTIARRYARFGEWGGLALWCDMTRDWVDEQGSTEACVALE